MEALAMLDHEPADLLIVDVLLAPPVLQLRSNKTRPYFDNGMNVLQAALGKRPTTPVLFISSHSSMTLLSRGMNGNRRDRLTPALRVFKAVCEQGGFCIRGGASLTGGETHRLGHDKATLRLTPCSSP